MRFKTIREKVAGEHTRDGVTVPVNTTREVRVPILPRNWDTIAVRFAVGLVLVLTTLSVVWSTYSIGSLLGGTKQAFAAALIFDFAWAVCLVLEYLARFDADKRKFPMRLGWVLLLATMGAIFWHGMTMGNVGMAVGGAAVSAFAKILWQGVMHHVNRELSEEDAQWVAAQISEANAKMAVADARRRAAGIEQRAALELLAMERETQGLREAMGLPAQRVEESAAAVLGADAPEAVAPAAHAALPSGITPEQLAAALALVQGTQAGASAPDDADDVTDAEEILPALEPPTLTDLSKADAVRIALQRRPDYAPSQIVDVLAAHGVETTPDYVRQVRNRDRAAATAHQDDTAHGEVVQLRKDA